MERCLYKLIDRANQFMYVMEKLQKERLEEEKKQTALLEKLLPQEQIMSYPEIGEWLDAYKPSEVTFFDVSPTVAEKYNGIKSVIEEMQCDLKRMEEKNA